MKILILKNLNYSIAQDVEQLKNWLAALGFNSQIDEKDIDLPLKWKSFGVYTHGELYGLDGIKQQLRDAMAVPVLAYDIVFFCYDRTQANLPVAYWTYPNHLNGAAFCEIFFLPQDVGRTAWAMIHECTHAIGRLLTWRKIYIVDNLDIGLDMIPYYKPYFPKLKEPLSIEHKLSVIQEIVNWIAEYLKKLKPETIEELIRRIAKEEGVDGELAVRVARCESQLNPKAVNTAGNTPPSRDRGLFQINSYWQGAISDEQAFDPEFATHFFCKAIKSGHLDWWNSSKTCWNK